MEQIERFIIENINEWHIQKEKYQKRVEIKEERTTKPAHVRLPLAALLEKPTCITAPIGTKENSTTEAKYLLTPL